MMERSDAFKVQIDTQSGLIAYDSQLETKKMIHIPYCMKLLIQELESICIAPRIITESVIQNVPVFKYIHQNISKYSIEQDYDNDNSYEEEGEN